MFYVHAFQTESTTSLKGNMLSEHDHHALPEQSTNREVVHQREASAAPQDEENEKKDDCTSPSSQ